MKYMMQKIKALTVGALLAVCVAAPAVADDIEIRS